MEAQRIAPLGRLSACGGIVLILLLAACALPRIVILDDPLSAQEHNDLGVVYEQKGMYDLAEKEYRLAIDKEKGWAVPWFNRGNLAYRRGDPSEAEKMYRKALTLDRANPDIMNNLAEVLIDRGQREEAKRLIDRALAIQAKPEYLDTARRLK